MKMAKWSASETGILRKKIVPENHEDLLVFGYACKLFRDDEKAKYIDQGKHLIPWMGDNSLRIDRYDCRGALSDLNSYEASREGYDAMRWLGLSESERKIEQLCDEERYHSLHTNEEEEEMYKEEELKRLQQKTNEFAYSYDVPQNPQVTQDVNPLTCEEEDKEYVPKPELNVPADITIPKTEKENARIEKTSLFVSKQGPQMEILIKTKQANNPQFSFLNQTDPLYKYYKHVLNALKSGAYKLESDIQEEEKKEPIEQDINDDHYLHPSLLQTSVQTSLPTIPTVTYKPTADCAYSQLVNRIQGSQTDGAVQNKNETDQSSAQNQMSYEQQQQQYYQYYYAMQYYEYYKQLVQQFHSMGGTDGQTIPPLIQEQINTQAATFAQMAYTQYIQQNNSNPYSQLVSNLSQAKENVYSPVPQTVSSDTGQMGDISKAPVIYGQTEAEKPQTQQSAATPPLQNQPVVVQQEEPKPKLEENSKKHVSKPTFPLVHYGSDSEEEDQEEEEDENENAARKAAAAYRIPPDETKLIIDKMASYVAKNGGDFENIVKSKGDPRFEFLNEHHEFHAYYKSKIRDCGGRIAHEAKDAQKTAQNGVSPPRQSEPPRQQQTQQLLPPKPKDKKIITPVCFSIKKPKEEIPKDIKSALPIEESDDETPEETTSTVKENTIKPPDTSHQLIPAVPAIVSNPKDTTSRDAENIPKEVTQTVNKEKKDSAENKTDNVDGDDPILEMIDLTEDLEEKKDARRAEDRIKDKLAAAAREKLAHVSKDRALQMERKKKAAAFLKLKSVETDKNRLTPKKEEKGEEDKVLVISDSDNKGDNDKEKNDTRSRSSTRENYHRKEESDSEEGEIRKHKKSSKKKKSHHKRKRSGSRHRSRSHYKKAKKRRRRSVSYHDSTSSED